MKMPFSLSKWIEESADQLKPPVGNKVLWEDSQFIAMIVGGPNARRDFHIDTSEEIFFQIKGNMTLRLLKNGKIENLPIKEGEIFLLPSGVPHSPQRSVNSVGLVIEKKRTESEKDGFVWVCENCQNIVYEIFVPVKDIEKDMPRIFQDFYQDQNLSKCLKCGSQMEKPSGPCHV